MAEEEQQQQAQDTQAPAPNGTGGGGRDWSYGLFGCFGDCKLCLITYFVPCYTAGKNAEAVGESCTTYGIFAVIPIANIICGGKIRGKIREDKGIAGSDVMDIIMHWICPLCAYIQEAREVADNQVNMAIDRY